MMTKNKILLGILGLLLAHGAAFGQNIFFDNFSSGNLSQWTSTGSWKSGPSAGNVLQNTVADSTITTTTVNSNSFQKDRIVIWNVLTLQPGPNDWNVAVLYPKYVDSNNYIYLILHTPDKNGNRALEYDLAASGLPSYQGFVHNLPASLDPTIQHEIETISVGNVFQVYIDGGLILNTSNPIVGQLAGSVKMWAWQSVVQVSTASVQNYNPAETVWVDDSVPPGANVSTYSGGNGGGPNVNTWTWVKNIPAPYSGSLAIQAPTSSPISQVSFGTVAFPVNTGDVLFAYVYLDPANLPSEIMLQYLYNNYGTWANVYWGADNITWGGRQRIGPMPTVTSAGWVRLQVTASQAGLGGQTVNAVALDTYGGTATWDHIGQAIGFAATAGSNGTISPSGSFAGSFGSNQTFTFTPNTGYAVADVQIDGVSQGSMTSYTFSNVISSHTINVTFKVASPNTGSWPGDTVWVDDSAPPGANVSSYSGGNGGGSNVNTWTWVNNPTPYSGSLAIQAPGSSPISQISFGNVAYAVNTADVLFAYVYLDPANLPSEIMLQYLYNNYGTWANVYWGADNITWGGRQRIGPMPTVTSAGWVRLQVPASQAGLGGQTVNAVALDTYGGTATWDYIGKGLGFVASAGSNGTISPSGSFSANYGKNQTFTFTPNAGYAVADVQIDGVSQGSMTSYTFSNVVSSHTINVTFKASTANLVVWVDDSVPSGANVSTYSGDSAGHGTSLTSWTWINNPTPYSGSLAIQAPTSSLISQVSFGNVAFPVSSGDTLFAYVYLDPAHLPSEIMLQYLYNNYSAWANVYWGTNSINWGGAQYMGQIPTVTSPGWVRLQVSANQAGLGGQTVNAVALDTYAGTATWDYIGKQSGQ